VVSALVKGVETILRDSGAQIIPDSGKFLGERKLELSSGDIVEFAYAIVATGSRNRNLPGIEVDDEYILDSTSALALDIIPQSILVIGAGAIGLELGLIFNRLGSKVTVVEVMSEILPGMDAEFAGKLRNSLTKEGMKFYLDSTVERVDKFEGYVEGIALNIRGHVSEGSGENIFLVIKEKLYTPPLSSSVLPGITRDTVMTIARELGVEVLEDTIPREMLYIADEIFFTGTAAEITPIKSIDKIPIGQGKRGPITTKIQQRFYAYINGQEEDRHQWLTYIPIKN